MSAHVCLKFIKRVGEKRQNARLAEHDLGIRQTTSVNSATLKPRRRMRFSAVLYISL